jgi:hypothetical protein
MSSSSANGHATPWRSLLKALHARGHQVTFFERDVPYYAAHRDLPSPEYCDLVLYSDWSSVLPIARRTLADADVAIVTSYCPDGLAACREVLAQSPALRVFYDLDTPVTLSGVDDSVVEVKVKQPEPGTNLVWGAFRVPAAIFRELHALWSGPGRCDEYIGTLVNEYLCRGGRAKGIAAGETYFDVGTVDGYRAAIEALKEPEPQLSSAAADS